MQVTEIAVADEIAAGASLLMGQAAEGLPVVVVRGLSFGAAARPASALVRPRERDMFR
jgi:coenzyme F420-0:L-glutamate ligase/coenzyme F420-1:gamma-L-glutamate ligase